MNSGAYELVRRSVEEHALSDDERLLERLRITQDKELPPMRFLFRIFGKPCFPRGELVADMLQCLDTDARNSRSLDLVAVICLRHRLYFLAYCIWISCIYMK